MSCRRLASGWGKGVPGRGNSRCTCRDVEGHGALKTPDRKYSKWSKDTWRVRRKLRLGKQAGPRSQGPVSPAEAFGPDPESPREPQRTQSKEWQGLGALRRMN